MPRSRQGLRRWFVQVGRLWVKKLMLALGATLAMSAALIAPAPAAASCTEVIDGAGCVEGALCKAADRVLEKSPVGRDSVDCIQ